jgi:hypothetical protein
MLGIGLILLGVMLSLWGIDAQLKRIADALEKANTNDR